LPSVYWIDMTQRSNQKSSQSRLPRLTAPPTQPGAYWFQSEGTGYEIVVDVSLKNGELIVWWLNKDVPITELTGLWRGPLKPFGTPHGR
jgi:hypothetical protein